MGTERDTIRIRPAVLEETAALSGIARRAKAFWGYPQEWLDLWAEALTVPAALVSTGNTFVAESVPSGSAAPQLLGFVALSRSDPTTWEIEHLWVEPEHMHRAIGRRLWEHVVAVCRARGAQRIEIDSDPHAEGFYARMGASRIGSTPSTPAGRMLPRMVSRLSDPV